MHCKNHPDAQAEARCIGCQESFCSNCLVEIRGQKYCGSCKVMAIKHKPVIEEANLPCNEADEALYYAIIGIFFFGIIYGPMAISRARKAKEMINLNPRLIGSGKATAALIIGIIAMILWFLGIITQFAK